MRICLTYDERIFIYSTMVTDRHCQEPWTFARTRLMEVSDSKQSHLGRKADLYKVNAHVSVSRTACDFVVIAKCPARYMSADRLVHCGATERRKLGLLLGMGHYAQAHQSGGSM